MRLILFCLLGSMCVVWSLGNFGYFWRFGRICCASDKKWRNISRLYCDVVGDFSESATFCSIEFAVIFTFLLLISEIVSQNQNQVTDWVDLWAVQRTDRQSLPFRSPFWRFVSLVDDGGKLEVRWRVERSWNSATLLGVSLVDGCVGHVIFCRGLMLLVCGCGWVAGGAWWL